jgi:2-iminobutanoate/2-iminopropanoate deaminase
MLRAQSAIREFFQPMTPVTYPRDPSTPVSHLPFSPCVRVGDLVFVSGQASVDAGGKIVEDDFEGEFRRSVENLRKVLASAGCGLEHIVQTRCYVDKRADIAEFNKLYASTFQAPYPARTTIVNCFDGLLKFEIDCIAVAPA